MSVSQLVAIMAAVTAALQVINAEERTSEHPDGISPPSLRSPTSSRLTAEQAEILLPVKTSQANDETSPPKETREQTHSTHTISSTDFAEKTASLNAKVLLEQKAQEAASLVEDPSTLGTKPKEKQAETEAGLVVKETPPKTEPDLLGNEGTSKAESKLPNTKLESDKEDSKNEENSHISEQTTVDSYKQMTLTEFANQVSDELKVFSNDAILAWSQIDLKVLWTGDAANALKDYNDAITISQAANNTECVKKDLKNYQTRTKTLEHVMKSCESGLKRETLQELQDKTKDLLNKMNDIVQEADNAVNKLPTSSPEFEKQKNDLESAAKEKLKELDTESVKKDLSELKDKALQAEEEEYNTCIDSKTEKSMIVDTLNDIMRIKNNCVG